MPPRAGGMRPNGRAPLLAAAAPPSGSAPRHRGSACGVQRREEERFLVGVFDDLAEIHHGDAVADVLDDGQIVGDEEIGQPLLLLQPHHQVDHLRLDRHIQRRDRLVGDDEPRVERERAGDADALPLATGEFVRIAAHLRRAQAHLVEQRGDAPHPLGARGDAVHLERLADDVARGHARVERGERILEDDLHLAPVRPELGRAQARDVVAAELNGARRRLDQTQDEPSDGRLAAAALADEAEGFCRADGEADPVHRAHMPDRPLQQALSHGEVLLEAADLEHRRGGGRAGHDTWSRSECQHAAQCPGRFCS